MTQQNHTEILCLAPRDTINWHQMRFKEKIQDTYVEGVQLKVSSRYMGGRHRQTPAFVITQKLSKDAASGAEPQSICIPIPSMGWRKAWKQALLALSAHTGRRHVVRNLNRPPKLDTFLVEPQSKQQPA